MLTRFIKILVLTSTLGTCLAQTKEKELVVFADGAFYPKSEAAGKIHTPSGWLESPFYPSSMKKTWYKTQDGKNYWRGEEIYEGTMEDVMWSQSGNTHLTSLSGNGTAFEALFYGYEDMKTWGFGNPRHIASAMEEIFHRTVGGTRDGEFTAAINPKKDLDWSKIDLENMALDGAALAGTKIGGDKLNRNDWTNLILDGVDLTGYDATGLAVTGHNFKGSNLQSTQLSGAQNINGCNLEGIDLSGLDLTGKEFQNNTLKNTGITPNQLMAAGNIFGCDMRETGISRADMEATYAAAGADPEVLDYLIW